ncbi:MAG: MbnP family protein [Bacteroidota bacterium]|nr:MbnP family protein [Bacteroidota bacterium]
MKNYRVVFILNLCLVFNACKKDTKISQESVVTSSQTYGNLTIEFENMVDSLNLQFATNYVNQNGDTFQVSTFKYFISNIVITKNDNSTFVEPESYHLIDHSDPTSLIVTLTKVPTGSYKSISFMVGVDSTRNVSGAQSGALSQSSGMFWTWSTGYIMLKLEGTSPKSPDLGKNIYFHVGGFEGINKAQRNFTLNFGSTTANVSTSITPKINLQTDLLEIFKNPSLVDFSSIYDVTNINSRSRMIADNYADMIRLEHVHNN